MKKTMFYAVNLLRNIILRKPKEVVRCIRCGRILKDPKSIKRGYGRVCLLKIRDERPDTTHTEYPMTAGECYK